MKARDQREQQGRELYSPEEQTSDALLEEMSAGKMEMRRMKVKYVIIKTLRGWNNG